MQAPFGSRRRIEAFDAALSGVAAPGRLPSRELALAAALGAAGTQIAASMPRHAAGALRDNLMAAAAHQASTLSTGAAAAGHAATQSATTATSTATSATTTAHTATTTAHTATAVATKTAGGLAAKLGMSGGMLSGIGAGSVVVPIAVGAIAANVLVGVGAITAHHSGVNKLVPVHPLASSAATVGGVVSPVAAQLQSQLDLLTSLEHVTLSPEQTAAFLHQWAQRTTSLVGLSGVRAAVREFAMKVQAELDRLSAQINDTAVEVNGVLLNAVSDVRRSLTGAVAQLPLLSGQVTKPTTPPTAVPAITPTPAATPTQLPTQVPTSIPTVKPSLSGINLPTQLPTSVPAGPETTVPGIDVGPIHVPPVTVPSVGL